MTDASVSAPRRFRTELVATMSTRGAVLLAGLVTSVVVARHLGPAGRGAFVVATTAAALLVQFGNLGLHASNTYVLGRDPARVGELLWNSLGVTLAMSAVAAALLVAQRAVWPGLVPLDGDLPLLVIGFVPFALALVFIQNLLLATGAVGSYNVTELLPRVVVLVLVCAAVLTTGLTAATAFAVSLAGTALAVAAGIVRLRGQWWPPKGSFTLLRSAIPYSAKAYLAALASYAVLRIDILVLGHFRGAAETGVYSVSVALADLLLTLPSVVGLLLFPRLSRVASPRERFEIAARMLVATVVAMAALSVATAVVARPVIEVLYGRAFVDAARPTVMLLPGVVALSAAMITNNYLASVGMPLVTVIAPAVALCVNVAVNIAVVPTRGASGAAAASSLAYAVLAALVILSVLRQRPWHAA